MGKDVPETAGQQLYGVLVGSNIARIVLGEDRPETAGQHCLISYKQEIHDSEDFLKAAGRELEIDSMSDMKYQIFDTARQHHWWQPSASMIMKLISTDLNDFQICSAFLVPDLESDQQSCTWQSLS